MNFSFIDRHCPPLYSPLKNRHYLVAHSLNLVIKSPPSKYPLSLQAMTGYVAWWLLQLNKFNITVVIFSGLPCRSLLGLLARFPTGECEPVHEDLSCNEIYSAPKNGTLPSIARPIIEDVGRKLDRTLLMAPRSFIFQAIWLLAQSLRMWGENWVIRFWWHQDLLSFKLEFTIPKVKLNLRL